MKIIVCIVLVSSIFITGCRTLPDLEGLGSHRTLAQEDSRFIEIDGFDLHYKTWGDGGDTLVLLHGFLSNLHTWDYLVDDLEGDFLLYAYDRLAFGITERPMTDEQGNKFSRSTNPYSTESVLRRLVTLLEVWDLNDVVLVGSSAGGNLAVQAALEYPDRIAGIVLIAPAVYQSGPPGIVRLLLRTGLFRNRGITYIRRLAEEDDSIFESSWYQADNMPEALKNYYRQPLEVENWDKALYEYTRMNRNPNIVKRLDSLDLPVLIIHGREDGIVPPEQSERLSRDLPRALLVLLEKTGHAPQEERPGETARLIREFSESIRTGE